MLYVELSTSMFAGLSLIYYIVFPPLTLSWLREFNLTVYIIVHREEKEEEDNYYMYT